jgi:hypothetical protein
MNSRRDPAWSSRVRGTIRARLESGLLPATDSLRNWAGPGLDKPCDACDLIVEGDDTEFELDFANETLRFHVGCLVVWQEERARLLEAIAIRVDERSQQ